MTQRNSRNGAQSGRKVKTGRKRISILLGGLLVMALCGTIRYYWGAPPANADPSGRPEAATSVSVHPSRPSADDVDSRESDPGAANRSESPIPAVVATVNTKRITREDLGRDCLRHFGKEVLESMVNKRLIMRECQQQGVTVSRHEVNDEIERMASRFKIPVDQWMKMLKQERNISSEQYANDIIWPTIALRRLAGDQLNVSREELLAEFDTQYGEQIRVRLIAVGDLQKAEDLRAQAVANPNNFGNLAKEYSEDSASASVKGVINPIRRHGSYEEIENAVFNMRDGDITPVIHVGEKYVFLKREQAIEAQNVAFEDVAPKLKEFLRDRKMRSIAQKVFQQIQEKAQKQQAVQNVWNDPARREKMPGVAALVYDDQITIRELAEECVARHGADVLEGTISHTLLELECRKQGIAITEEEIDQEIARAALAGVKAKSDGSPDVAAWLTLVTKKQGISLDVYRHDAVWPAVALKKLVGDSVKVTEEDLKKGYEANYGERVRCLAIVLNDARRAQQVFEMARKDNTPENFGKLAAQYSIEPGSQALQGEVPPIQRHGGQPILEEEAFQLKPGELSGVIQIDNRSIILRCEGRTKPIGVQFAEVRDEIYRDLYEKKLHRAIGERFESIRDAAIIDNYLANTSHSPKASKAPASARLPTLRQMPSL